MNDYQTGNAEDFLARQGYRRCDISACNCGSWHGGHANQRLRELREAFEQDEHAVANGKNLLTLVCETLGERARLRAELAKARKEIYMLRAIASMLDAVVEGAQCDFVRVPYGASHENVAQINEWHAIAREARSEFAAIEHESTDTPQSPPPTPAGTAPSRSGQ